MSCAVKVLLGVAALAVLPFRTNAASVSLDIGSSTGRCLAGSTDSPVASVTVPSQFQPCELRDAANITASELPWTALITTSGGDFGDFSSAIGSANLTAIAQILGGSGSGFIDIVYTDLIIFGSSFAGSADASAGPLSVHDVPLTLAHPAITFASSHATGFLPFTFGDEIPVSASASLNVLLIQAGFESSVSETITFDIRDANMNAVAGAFVQAAPEPSMFSLLGAILLLYCSCPVIQRCRSRLMQGGFGPSPNRTMDGGSIMSHFRIQRRRSGL